MCGIVGVHGWGDRDTLHRMTQRLEHRGPDDGGGWDTTLPDGTYVGLGNRRLSIIDLTSAGHMPMGNEAGTVWLTYNGELYNAPALRAELEQKGHRFRSRTDTEVVLKLVEECGADAVARLEGMFAFAAVDLRPKPPSAPPGDGPVVLLARDPFGVKPLYYVHDGRRLAFASEAKALLDLPGFKPRMDLESLHRYLTFLWVPDPDTLFEGVKKLPASHLATFRGGELRLREYWNLVVPPRHKAWTCGESEVHEGIRARLRSAVQSQMVSDVPLGAFLSSGVDSSAIVAFMAEASSEPVRTFTVTFPERHRRGERTLDDPAIARRTAQRFGAVHHEMVVEPDVVGLLPKLVWHMDEPVADPALITAHLVCAEARPHVKVLLSGVGGDELFGGYRKHAAYRMAARYQRIPRALRRWLVEPMTRSLPTFRGTALMGPVRHAKKLARTGSLPAHEAFLANATYLDDGEKTLLYAPALRDRLDDVDPYRVHEGHFADVREADFINQMLYLDLKTFMVSLNLTYNDKMSMATSLEVRVPFLDRGLATYAFGEVPPDWKVTADPKPVTKQVLRKALKGIVPDEVLAAPKAGFGAPHDHWLAHDLREMVDDLLSDDQVRSRGLFNPGSVRTLVQEHRQGRRDWSYQVWQLLTLELWQRAFLDAKGGRP
jgi:asparagine synthase (glutamine-hydrolysing)